MQALWGKPEDVAYDRAYAQLNSFNVKFLQGWDECRNVKECLLIEGKGEAGEGPTILYTECERPSSDLMNSGNRESVQDEAVAGRGRTCRTSVPTLVYS